MEIWNRQQNDMDRFEQQLSSIATLLNEHFSVVDEICRKFEECCEIPIIPDADTRRGYTCS